MTDVILPDGSIGRFPDEMSDEDIEAVLRQEFGRQQPPPPGGRPGLAESIELIGRASPGQLGAAVADVAKDAVTGAPGAIARGAGNLVETARDVAVATGRGIASAVTDPVGTAKSAAIGAANLGKEVVTDPEAFIRGVGSGAGGLGEAVEVGRQMVMGKRGREADIAAARAREEAASRSQGAYTLGQLVGGLGLGGRAAISGGPVRGAATGATLAGGQASAEGEDVASSVVSGAFFGGSMPAAARVVKSTGALARGAFPDRGATRLMESRLKIKSDADVDKLVREASQKTGRKISVAEVLTEQAAKDAGQIVSRSAKASEAARKAFERISIERQNAMPGAIAGRRTIVTERALRAERGEEFEKAFNPIRNRTVDVHDIPEEDLEILVDAASILPEVPGKPRLPTAVRAQTRLLYAERNAERAQKSVRIARREYAAAIRGDDMDAIEDALYNLRDAQAEFREAYGELVDAHAIAQEYPITLDDLDAARRDIARQADAGLAVQQGGKNLTKKIDTQTLSTEVRDIAERISPEYRKILSNYSRRSRRLEAAFGGSRKSTDPTFDIAKKIVTGQAGPVEIADALAAGSAAGRSGARIGVISRLAEESAKSAEKAQKVAKRIAEDAGLQKSIISTLGEQEGKRIIDLAKLENAAHRAMSQAARGVTTQADEAANIGADIARLGYAPQAGGAMRAALTAEITNMLHAPPNVAARLADMLFDPDKAEIAFKRLRRMAKSDEEFVKFLQRARASGATQVVDENSRRPELRE